MELAESLESWGTLRECRFGHWEPQKPKSGEKCYIGDSPDQLQGLPKEWGDHGGRQGVAFELEKERRPAGGSLAPCYPIHPENKGSFSALEMLEQGTRAIKIDNTVFLEVAEVGTVGLGCQKVRRSTFVVRCLYSQCAREPLFSVKKTSTVRAKVMFHGEVCEFSSMVIICKNAKRASW